MPWGFDSRSRRYRDSDTGRFLSRDQALAFVDQSIDATGSVTDQLATLVADGRLSADDWRLRMRQEIRSEYIRQAILGNGGREQMTPAAWGQVGGNIAEQYRFLDRQENSFYDQVAAGELTEGQIAARSRLYVNSAREMYEAGQQRRLRGSDYDEVRWVLGDAQEHCADCVALAAQNWMPVADLNQRPGDGSTQCVTGCRCHLEYRVSDTGEQFGEDTERMIAHAH